MASNTTFDVCLYDKRTSHENCELFMCVYSPTGSASFGLVYIYIYIYVHMHVCTYYQNFAFAKMCSILNVCQRQTGSYLDTCIGLRIHLFEVPKHT